jgi:hypothetical protein
MELTAFSFLASSSSEFDGNQKMELTIRSLSFYVRPSGSTRLSDPAELGPLASNSKTITVSGSSVGSSSEVNSPVSLEATGSTQEKSKELDGIQEKLGMEGSSNKTSGSKKDLATGSSGVSRSIHQLYVIITEVAEGNGDTDNEEGNAQINKPMSNGKKEKEKIHVSTGEWKMIISAINCAAEVPANSRREVLMG